MSFEWRDTVLHSILSHKRMHVSLQYSVFIILLNEVLNSFLYINESEYTKYSYYVNCRRKYETMIFLLISLLLLKDVRTNCFCASLSTFCEKLKKICVVEVCFFFNFSALASSNFTIIEAARCSLKSILQVEFN